MTIALACPVCATSVQVTADMAGKRAKCPECLLAIALPATLIESPEWGAAKDSATLEAAPAAGRRSMLAWVLGIGGLAFLLVAVCGGGVGATIWLLWRSGDTEAARLAGLAVVHPVGADLPAGAPPRAMRVTEFEGVFQVRSHLANGDVVFRNAAGGGNNINKVCKEYVIDLEAGRSYIIQMDTPNFDAYLRLEHLNGQGIAENDDSGGTLNSRIDFTPIQSGSYVVVATALTSGFGPFTLTVREAQFGKPR